MKFKTYLEMYEENWKPFNDVLPCLKKLSGYKLGIISNGDLNQQSRKLRKIGVKDYFNTIIIAGDLGVAKPDIEIFEIACKQAEVSPKESYYVGDDFDTDILPCIKAKMTGVWINRCNDRKHVSNVHIIHNLEDLEWQTSKK